MRQTRAGERGRAVGFALNDASALAIGEMHPRFDIDFNRFAVEFEGDAHQGPRASAARRARSSSVTTSARR